MLTANVSQQLGYGPGIAIFLVFGGLAYYSAMQLWRMFIGLDSPRYPVRNYVSSLLLAVPEKADRVHSLCRAMSLFACLVTGLASLPTSCKAFSSSLAWPSVLWPMARDSLRWQLVGMEMDICAVRHLSATLLVNFLGNILIVGEQSSWQRSYLPSLASSSVRFARFSVSDIWPTCPSGST